MASGISNVIAIASLDAEGGIKALVEREPDASLEDRARAAMRRVQDHWLAPEEGDQFVAACEALARTGSEEEKDRIVDDLRRLQQASALIRAMQAGIPVDIEKMAETAKEAEAESPLGLRKIWAEVTR